MNNLTPAQKVGLKPGDMVRVIDGRGYIPDGEVVEFRSDDGTLQPAFWTKDKSDYWFLYVNNVEKVGTKGAKPMARRTFKLVKAIPGFKVGALFQEECEDGTQPYSPIPVPGMDMEHDVRLNFKNRALVEDSPFFVEVFKVNPQYMTQAELDQYDAFKKTSKPAKRKYTKRAIKTTK